MEAGILFNQKSNGKLDLLSSWFDLMSLELVKWGQRRKVVGWHLVTESLICRVVNRARRVRKVMGGGMRQAGIIAAAGLYSLNNMVERLVEDHIRTKAIAKGIVRPYFLKQCLPPIIVNSNTLFSENLRIYTISSKRHYAQFFGKNVHKK